MKSYEILIICLVVAGAAIAWYFYNRGTKKEKARLAAEAEKMAAESQRRQLLDTQDNLGNRIFNAMKKAAEKNQNGPVVVEKILQNGKSGYTVVVGWKDDTSFTYGGVNYRGFHVISISVNLDRLGHEIHTFENSYGPDNNYSLSKESIEALIAKWSETVEAWSLYVKN